MRRPLVRTSSQENNLFDPRKKSEISFLLFHLLIIFLTADIGMRRSKSSLTASCKNQKLDNCFQSQNLLFHNIWYLALANRPLRKIAMANSHKTAGQRSQFFFRWFSLFQFINLKDTKKGKAQKCYLSICQFYVQAQEVITQQVSCHFKFYLKEEIVRKV